MISDAAIRLPHRMPLQARAADPYEVIVLHSGPEGQALDARLCELGPTACRRVCAAILCELPESWDEAVETSDS